MVKSTAAKNATYTSGQCFNRSLLHVSRQETCIELHVQCNPLPTLTHRRILKLRMSQKANSTGTVTLKVLALVSPCTMIGHVSLLILVGIIMGSFFWGYIITQVPGGRLAESWGSKKLLGFSILFTSLLTIVSPSVARMSPVAFMFCRALEGMFEG